MNKRMEKIFLAVTLVLCVLLFLLRLTGDAVHGVLGLVLTAMIVVHTCRQKVKLKYQKTSIQWVDWMLIAALAVLVLTGVLLHPLHGILILKILHKLAAIVFVLGVIVHAVQHMKVKKRI